jgi:hypothetical protein
LIDGKQVATSIIASPVANKNHTKNDKNDVFSNTANVDASSNKKKDIEASSDNNKEQQRSKSNDSNNTATALRTTDETYDVKGLKALFIQISVVFVLIAGYYAMVLTNWATLQSKKGVSSPTSGYSAMWLQASGQWIAVTIYVWSLIVPALFPDRDFS